MLNVEDEEDGGEAVALETEERLDTFPLVLGVVVRLPGVELAPLLNGLAEEADGEGRVLNCRAELEAPSLGAIGAGRTLKRADRL